MNRLLALGVCFISIKLTVCDTDRAWMSFKATYNKTYVNMENEEIRRQIFINNTLMIQKHNEKFNRGEVTFNMGMNTFGDLTYDEFLKLFVMGERRRKRSIQTSLDGINDKIPSNATIKEVNGTHLGDEKRRISSISRESCSWTGLPAVNSVKDQGNCKSGWAYSAADAIAARYNVHYNRSCPSLSIPYLIHCSTGMGNHGCNGGLAEKACRLVEKTKQMPDENSFKKNCLLNKMKNTVTLNIKMCRTMNLPSKLIDIPKNLCEFGPMSASISAEQPSFQFAKEGIYSEDECDQTSNHEVLLVGYHGKNTENPYWIVKNSFGTSWGDNGFLKIAAKSSKNGCRIINQVSFPVF